MEFKVKKQEYVNRTYRLPKELLERLAETAQREGISINELIVQCCGYALDNQSDSRGNTTEQK